MKPLWILALAAALVCPRLANAEQQDLLASKDRFYSPKLGGRVPTDLTFKDETGKEVRLGEYGQTKPIILVPVYFRCPRLCNLVLQDLVKSLRLVPFTAGTEFDVVVVSFDTREKPELAAANKALLVEEYGRRGGEKGWHFLTGNQPEIDSLLESVGFGVVWDEKDQQFAHGRAIMILTSDWMVTRYFLDGSYPPRDLRLALVEASEGKVGSPMDRILLMCFNYNPVTGKYSVAILNVVRIGGLLTIGLVVLFWVLASWRGRKKKPVEAVPGPVTPAGV